MAWTIGGVAARVIGVVGGLTFLVPAVSVWIVLGAVTANVPLPPGVEQFVESAVPVLRGGVPGTPEPTLPLEMLLPAGFFVIAFSLLGSFLTLGALLKPEYTLNLRGGGPRGRGP